MKQDLILPVNTSSDTTSLEPVFHQNKKTKNAKRSFFRPSSFFILLVLLLSSFYGRCAAYIVYGPQNDFLEMDSADRDAAILTLSVKHFKRPSNPIYIRQLADAYTAKGQTDSALTYWQLLSARQPLSDTALFMQAQMYYDMGRLDSAASLAQRAVDLRPGQLGYLSLLAMTAYRLHNADTAFSICQDILALSPADPDALLLAGIILRDEKKDSAALSYFDRCLKADPANTDALVHRADEYVLLKKYNDAIRDYSAARADLSGSADILNNIGICYYHSGAYQQAISFFKKAILINHLHPQSYFNKGLSYYHLNELDTATIDIKTASAIWDTCYTDTCHANFLDAIYYLGMCYRKIGDLPTARSHFELLQRDGYHRDLSDEIRLIDRALFISRSWYYFLLVLLLTVGLIIVLVRMMRRS
jgi:tetratricopeptide (TPR) repeat protein